MKSSAKILLCFLLILFTAVKVYCQTPSADCSTAGAQQLTVGTSCGITFNASNALGNPASPTCGFTGSGLDGWGWFTATATTTLVDYTNTNGDAQIYIYTGACGSLVQYACADAVTGTGRETVSFSTTIGSTYAIRIVRYTGASTMNGEICVYNAPTNDTKCTATSLGTLSTGTYSQSLCGNNAGMTSTGDGTASCYFMDKGAWYSVTVNTVPSTLTISTSSASTNFDTQISIYSSSNGLCSGTFTQIGCDDQSGATTNSSSSTMSITSTGTYWILLDGYNYGYGYDEGYMCMTASLQTCTDGIQNQNEAGTDCGGVCTACSGTGYLHPTSTLVSGSAVGACVTNTCAGNYYDSGNSGGAYTLNALSIYRTFCPDVTGKCLRVAFSSLGIDLNMMGTACGDLLAVLNGPSGGSTMVSAFCANVAVLGSTTTTSTDSSGCLTFAFAQDGASYGWYTSGWAASFSCVNCAVANLNGTQNNDCTNATTLCADASFSGSSPGPGLSVETCADCIAGENYSSWYKIIVSASGALQLDIKPTLNTADYDFSIYKSSSCGSLGSAIRCSYGAYSGTGSPAGANYTGLRSSETDLTEGASGNQYVDTLSVTVGDNYYLCINNFNAGGTGFVVDWTFLNGASISCSPLPVTLMQFKAKPFDYYNELSWEVAEEINLKGYEVEKSINNKWVKINEVKAAGSNSFYLAYDEKPLDGENYYRLKMVDLDGKFKYSDLASAYHKTDKDRFVVVSIDNTLKIDAASNIATIAIYNALGQQLYYRKSSDGYNDHFEMSTDKLSAGIYYVKINDNFSYKFYK